MKLEDRIENPAVWLESITRNFINGSRGNSLKNREMEKAWDEPLIGFSRGDDPLYQEDKEYIGPFHWTPLEIFEKSFPYDKVEPDQLTVISWILPQTELAKSDNRKQAVCPSERWARAKSYGEEVNLKLAQHVVATLKESGCKAVAPVLSPFWEKKTAEPYVVASTWSERHAAYAAGLGTFGLCDGLITSKGKAMRCGSVVARIRISPTHRPYSNPHDAYCLYFQKGECRKCAQRCPVGTLTEAGHDKVICKKYFDTVIAEYVKSQFGIDGAGGCGLCQTGGPCESRMPFEGALESNGLVNNGKNL